MATTPASDQPIPTFDIARVFRLKRAIEQDLDLACYVGTKPEGQDYEFMVRRFRDRLPGADLDALRKSLLELTGRTITTGMLSMTAWRLAGNLPRLKAGREVIPWTRQQVPEWVPLQVVGTKVWISKRGRRGGMFQFQILAGTPCPLKIEKFWTREFCGMVARRMGFTRLKGKYPYQHTNQLVGMRFLAHISPIRSREQPDFDEVAEATGGVLKHNKALLKARHPLHRVCPSNYPTSQACHLCPVGMTACDLATHVRTYVRRICRQHKLEAWHDPATGEDLCMDCQYARMRELQGQKKEG